jgi:hypothetical protein
MDDEEEDDDDDDDDPADSITEALDREAAEKSKALLLLSLGRAGGGNSNGLLRGTWLG